MKLFRLAHIASTTDYPFIEPKNHETISNLSTRTHKRWHRKIKYVSKYIFFKCDSIAIDPPANNADQISAGQGKSVIQPLRHQ